MSRFPLALVVVAFAAAPAAATDINLPPINYDTAAPDDAVARLGRDVAAGRVALAHTHDHGYLRAVLRALRVPESSQVLVFSKTQGSRTMNG